MNKKTNERVENSRCIQNFCSRLIMSRIKNVWDYLVYELNSVAFLKERLRNYAHKRLLTLLATPRVFQLFYGWFLDFIPGVIYIWYICSLYIYIYIYNFIYRYIDGIDKTKQRDY